jgi:hypothetical protein
VVQPWSAAGGERDVVDGGLSQQPRAGHLLVLAVGRDVLRAPEAKPEPEPKRLLQPRRVQVQVVEAQDRRSAVKVEALQLRLELLHREEELERVAERIPYPQ